MILLFDLDHTILDVEKFKKEKSKLFRLTPEENEKHGFELFKKHGKGYNPYQHIKFLRDSNHIQTDKEAEIITQQFNEAIKDTDKYLIDGAENTLSYLKEKGYKMVLMTFGDLQMQKPKVDNSRIKKYFEKIIYSEKDKSENEFLKELANSNEDVLIINDHAEQSLAMQKVIGPKAKIFLVKGPYAENTDHKETIHNNINELKNIL
ncbi:MAG: HAD hydrolase-like protein [Candidatus Staskawiczbacteria bacterium]|jgi:FMN phosphatase YigB (HAD superfamily)